MEPKPPPENLSPLLENQQKEYKEHALVDHESTESAHCDVEDTKESRTWEIFKTKVLEFAQESRISPEHISLIERSLPDLFPDLHVPNHPPYAAMIRKAITELDEAGGSSDEVISIFIRKEQNDLPWAHATLLKHHLEKLCQSGDIVVTGEKCYMLNTTCETSNTNQIVDFNPIQISASPIPSLSLCSSPSSGSSSSYSDYIPYAKKRKQKTTGRKYGKKSESEEEHSEETEEESEESYTTEEELEVTEVGNRLIKYKGKHTHRTEGARKNKTEDKSEFRDEQLRVIPVKHQVHGTYNTGPKLVRARGRPLKCLKPKTYMGPKEPQVGLIETHNQVAEIPVGLKQKRGRGRPPKVNQVIIGIPNKAKESRESSTKNIGIDTHIGPKEVHKEVRNTFNKATKDLNMPREKRGRGRPPKNMGIETNIVQATKDFNMPREKRGRGRPPKNMGNETNIVQATKDLNMPSEKRGRGRPPKNMGNETNIVQKEAQGKVIDVHNQTDCMEKPKQKRGPGRPPKNSGGQMVLMFEVQNQTAEDGMKLKQGRKRFSGEPETEKVSKYLDELELTVIQEMFEKMKI